MKKLIVVAFIMLCGVTGSVPAFGQSNLPILQIVKEDKSNPKSRENIIGKAVAVGQVTIKGKQETVYRSATGKTFVVKLSRHGNYYKKYVNVQ